MMKISRDWLAQYVTVDCDLETLCGKLTMAGIEVEAVTTSRRVPRGVVAAKILERAPHAGSDHLSVCRVFDGERELQVVCGAPNCDAGRTVPLATVGTVFDAPEGRLVIRKTRLRGVDSCGMLCSGRELGLNDDHSGIMILDDAVAAGTPLEKLYPGDSCIEVEVTPNRPDLLSHWGVARDVGCLLNVVPRLPEVVLPPTVPAPPDLVSVEEPELCPRYIGRVIRGVRVGESPDWLKERLCSVGLRPINNVVDVTNFILMELGQPLHAFDLDLLAGGRVVVRRARAGETIVTLDGVLRELSPRHLVIADGEKPMALAGIMGGEYSGISDRTVDILLESAVFRPSSIRATARELAISSDASYRYERGVDYDMAAYASDRAAQLIMQVADGREATDRFEVSSGRPEPKRIVCRFGRVRGLIGVDVADGDMVDIFRRLHLKVTDLREDGCTVEAPLFRPDLEREADLAEEVARIHGLDAIPVRPVVCKAVSSMADDVYWRHQQLRDELVGHGLDECVHYSMVDRKSALCDSRFDAGDLVTLKNPVSSDLVFMRPSLLGGMLGTVERNVARRSLDLRLFELGKVFCADAELYPEERYECCIALTGRKHPERYSGELDELYDFYDLKGLLESWLEQRGADRCVFEPVDDPSFEPGTSVVASVGKRRIARLGQLPAKLTRSWRTPYAVFAALVDVDGLLAVGRRDVRYREPSQFPSVSRDVAFVADDGLEHAAVVGFIRGAGLKNLESVRLFDIFTDEKTLGPGRKSMAYQLTFRHAERTLTDGEVNAACERLRGRLARELKVELR